jgi:presenilin enhancer 2
VGKKKTRVSFGLLAKHFPIIMPSLDKLSGTEILSIGKKMFYGGFAFLPFLWLVNVIYLWPTLKRSDVPPKLRSCKTRHLDGFGNATETDNWKINLPILLDLIYSICGCVTWFIISTTWYALYVNKRVAWGVTADRITVVIPKGV